VSYNAGQMPSVEQRLQALEGRLQALEDERSILRTIYQYASALDEDREPDNFLDCFTESAVWTSSIDGRYAGAEGATVRLDGHNGLEAWFRRRGIPDHKSKKYLCDAVIEIDGDKARCTTNHLDVHEKPEGPVIWAIGRYFDRMVRCRDGRWRFQERHLVREGVAPAGQKTGAGAILTQ
jgi:SnoaL-like domain